ncbi:endoglucanase [Desulfonispora thiosulfatigenes DSM 11270]|uniref:Endoglucanase n=1 Tax=Desulfonispora thiosulfatigenes DSM 11270 TaxID=656914 RepID=A0A1W1VC55_DESTI|nr:M42 family metallopeptidase [Desulfonispora thiosulfatigenes]SMB90554.1 endoglucanase [Desulfonispora thiosulfatigenes DSM 11270]
MLSRFLTRLKTLTSLVGVTGYEQEVIKYLRDEFKMVSDEVIIDPLGNLIAVKKGTEDGPSLMLTAHADEIGFCVKNILSSGFIQFEKVGNFSDKILAGRAVWIISNNQKIPGIIGIKSSHLSTAEEKNKIQSVSELYIDLGTSSKEEVEKLGINIGDRIIPQSELFEMSSANMVCSRALDNRINCAVILELFHELQGKEFKGTLYGVITIQEELAYTGGSVVANTVDPDYAIILDTIPSMDTPGVNLELTNCIQLGKGPACPLSYGLVGLGNTYIHIHPAVRKIIEESSREANIDVQYITLLQTNYTTDAPMIAKSNKGVPIGTLTVPRRYSHSPHEVANIRDAVDLIKLLKVIVKRNGEQKISFLFNEI